MGRNIAALTNNRKLTKPARRQPGDKQMTQQQLSSLHIHIIRAIGHNPVFAERREKVLAETDYRGGRDALRKTLNILIEMSELLSDETVIAVQNVIHNHMERHEHYHAHRRSAKPLQCDTGKYAHFKTTLRVLMDYIGNIKLNQPEYGVKNIKDG